MPVDLEDNGLPRQPMVTRPPPETWWEANRTWIAVGGFMAFCGGVLLLLGVGR